MILTSLKNSSEIFTVPPKIFPETGYVLSHYFEVFRNPQFLIYIKNSVIVAGCSTIISVLIGTLAAVGVARFKFKGKNLFKNAIIITQLFPLTVLLVPIFVLWKHLSLLNTYVSLIFTYLSFSLPLAIWMIIPYIQDIPKEIEEAAIIDGCKPLNLLFRIFLPLAMPGIIATSTYVFIMAFQEYILALALISDSAKFTLPIGITSFVGQNQIDWGGIMAASIITTIPVIILFGFFSKKIINNLSGASKG